ncbi:MAG TPA: FGGY-family carbohydrate kinase [Gemmataceae bacterium]|nr:FGGY-family carbohydrate kinase [Gemmataceae bacterium]
MPESLRFLPPESIITGWDFSTGGVKCLAFDVDGNTVAEARLPTDLWTEGGVSELNLMQLEGQARAISRAITDLLADAGRLSQWAAGGISATHHTNGRIDENGNQVRRAICWNDHTLAEYHARGLERLGGQEAVHKLIGGPWAIRYSLSHLVKDESCLAHGDWERTNLILPHGSLAAGYLTSNFNSASVSAAASTGMMDLRTHEWCQGMLMALDNADHRRLAFHQLPTIYDEFTPVGQISESVAHDLGLAPHHRPQIFPTSDDQQAGLVGGGAVDAGQMAIILGNSAVVNSSGSQLPAGDGLDAMKLNWGPYLWMRCYNNGAQFLDRVVGVNPNWEELEKAARACPPGANGHRVSPFASPEPSLGVAKPRFEWAPREPAEPGVRFRASLEALAYLIAWGVQAHEKAGQKITRITVSGGIARSPLMCEILATVLNKKLERLQSDEGPALGAAVTALAAMETHLRRHGAEQRPFTVADAVAAMVKFKEPALPNPSWREAYVKELRDFGDWLKVRA